MPGSLYLFVDIQRAADKNGVHFVYLGKLFCQKVAQNVCYNVCDYKTINRSAEWMRRMKRSLAKKFKKENEIYSLRRMNGI